MKIRKIKKSPLRYVLAVAVVVVVSALGYLYYAHHFQKWPYLPSVAVTNPENTVNYNKPTSSQTDAGTMIKQQTADQAKNNNTPTTSGASPTTTIDITSANKMTSTLAIRTLIQKVTSTGTCSLTMSGPSGSIYTATAGVQALASSSTCQGFDVPLSSLSSGAWSITVNFQDGISTASSTKQVTI